MSRSEGLAYSLFNDGAVPSATWESRMSTYTILLNGKEYQCEHVKPARLGGAVPGATGRVMRGRLWLNVSGATCVEDAKATPGVLVNESNTYPDRRWASLTVAASLVRTQP